MLMEEGREGAGDAQRTESLADVDDAAEIFKSAHFGHIYIYLPICLPLSTHTHARTHAHTHTHTHTHNHLAGGGETHTHTHTHTHTIILQVVAMVTCPFPSAAQPPRVASTPRLCDGVYVYKAVRKGLRGGGMGSGEQGGGGTRMDL